MLIEEPDVKVEICIDPQLITELRVAMKAIQAVGNYCRLEVVLDPSQVKWTYPAEVRASKLVLINSNRGAFLLKARTDNGCQLETKLYAWSKLKPVKPISDLL